MLLFGLLNDWEGTLFLKNEKNDASKAGFGLKKGTKALGSRFSDRLAGQALDAAGNPVILTAPSSPARTTMKAHPHS